MNRKIIGGALYSADEKTKYAMIRSDLFSQARKICFEDGTVLASADVFVEKGNTASNVKRKQYVLKDAEGKEIMKAQPGYAEGEDPDVNGWPAARMPRADHAEMEYDGVKYTLLMRNTQNYALLSENNETVAQIIHRGIMGGWDVITEKNFPSEVLLGIFIFCRYIESENELTIV